MQEEGETAIRGALVYSEGDIEGEVLGSKLRINWVELAAVEDKLEGRVSFVCCFQLRCSGADCICIKTK